MWSGGDGSVWNVGVYIAKDCRKCSGGVYGVAECVVWGFVFGWGVFEVGSVWCGGLYSVGECMEWGVCDMG